MISTDVIRCEANRIRRQYNESDPIRLCRAMGILLLWQSMGVYEGCCKGFYMMQSRIQVIVLNNDLPPTLQRVILAHEIGHAVLHKKIRSISTFHDFQLFDKTSRYEYEANIFAAEFLMQDKDVLEFMKGDASFFNAAKELNVPEELLDFKLRILQRRKGELIDPPLMASADFLKRVNCTEQEGCEHMPEEIDTI